MNSFLRTQLIFIIIITWLVSSTSLAQQQQQQDVPPSPFFLASHYVSSATNAQAIARSSQHVFIAYYTQPAKIAVIDIDSGTTISVLTLTGFEKPYCACVDNSAKRVYFGSDTVPGAIAVISSEPPLFAQLASLTLTTGGWIDERYISSCVVNEATGDVIFGNAASPGLLVLVRPVNSGGGIALQKVSVTEVEGRLLHAAVRIPNAAYHKTLFVGATSPGAVLSLGKTFDPSDETSRYLFSFNTGTWNKPRCVAVVPGNAFVLLGLDESRTGLHASVVKLAISSPYMEEVGHVTMKDSKKLMSVAVNEQQDIFMFAAMGTRAVYSVNATSMKFTELALPNGVFACRVGVGANDKAFFGLSQYPSATDVPAMQYITLSFRPPPPTAAPTTRPANSMLRRWVVEGAPPEHNYDTCVLVGDSLAIFSMSVSDTGAGARFRVFRFTSSSSSSIVGHFNLPAGMDRVSSTSVVAMVTTTYFTTATLVISTASIPDSMLILCEVDIPHEGVQATVTARVLQNRSVPSLNHISTATYNPASPDYIYFATDGNGTASSSRIFRVRSDTLSIDQGSLMALSLGESPVLSSVFSTKHSKAVFLAHTEPRAKVIVFDTDGGAFFRSGYLGLKTGEVNPVAVSALQNDDNIILLGCRTFFALVVKIQLVPLRRLGAFAISPYKYITSSISVGDSVIFGIGSSPAVFVKVKFNPSCGEQDFAFDATLTMDSGEGYPRAGVAGKGEYVFSAMWSFGTTPGRVGEIWIGDPNHEQPCTSTSTTTTTTTTTVTPAPPSTPVPAAAPPTTAAAPLTTSPPIPTTQAPSPPSPTAAPAVTTAAATTTISSGESAAASASGNHSANPVICFLGDDGCLYSILIWCGSFVVLLLLLLLGVWLKRRGVICSRGAKSRRGINSDDGENSSGREGRELRDAFLRVPHMNVADVRVPEQTDQENEFAHL